MASDPTSDTRGGYLTLKLAELVDLGAVSISSAVDRTLAEETQIPVERVIDLLNLAAVASPSVGAYIAETTIRSDFEVSQTSLKYHAYLTYFDKVEERLCDIDDRNLFHHAESIALEAVEFAQNNFRSAQLDGWMRYRAGKFLLAPWSLGLGYMSVQFFDALRADEFKRSVVWTDKPDKADSILPMLQKAMSLLSESTELLNDETCAMPLTALAAAHFLMSERAGKPIPSEAAMWCRRASGLISHRQYESTEYAPTSTLLAWMAIQFNDVGILHQCLPLRLASPGQLVDTLGRTEALETYCRAIQILRSINARKEAGNLAGAALAFRSWDTFDRHQDFLYDSMGHGSAQDPSECAAHIITKLALPELPVNANSSQVAQAVHAFLHLDEMDMEACYNWLSSIPQERSQQAAPGWAFLAQRSLRAALDASESGQWSKCLRLLILSLTARLILQKATQAAIVVAALEDVLLKAPKEDILRMTSEGFVDHVIYLSDRVLAICDDRSRAQLLRVLGLLFAVLGSNPEVKTYLHLAPIEQMIKGRAYSSVIGAGEEHVTDPILQRALKHLGHLKDASWTTDPGIRSLMFATMDAHTRYGSFVSNAEREPGVNDHETARNLKRICQRQDSLLMHRAISRWLRVRYANDIADALKESEALVSFCLGGVGDSERNGFHAAIYSHPLLRLIGVFDPETPAYQDFATVRGWDNGEGFLAAVEFSQLAMRIGGLRRAILDDPLFGVVSPEGREALADIRHYFSDLLMDEVEKLARSGITHLYIWPHQALFALPFSLIPFRDGALHDYFSISILPSIECLFAEEVGNSQPGRTLVAASPGGGIEHGFRFEAAIMQQAAAVAELMGTEVRRGLSASPHALRNAFPDASYIHLVAHGGPDPFTPLFQCLFMEAAPPEDNCLYAYQLTNLDLKNVRVVTLSACEAAIQRFDREGNTYGLIASLFRGGVKNVVAALWPVTPEVASTFFLEFYRQMRGGSHVRAAYRRAQVLTRDQWPQYRDWGAFVLFGGVSFV